MKTAAMDRTSSNSSSSTPRPRVLQVITHLALGGAERVAFNLIEGLRDQFDFAVYVANGIEQSDVGRSMQAELQALNVPLYVGTSVPIKRGGMLMAGWWMARAVKQFQPQIIHLHTEIPESSYAAMVTLRPGLKRIPLVRTMHNTTYWNPWRKLGIWSDRKMPRSYIASVSKGAQEAFEQLRNESSAGALPREPVLIFNGVSVKPMPRRRAEDDLIRILFAGRFEPQKGADLLPEIVRQVSAPGGMRCELVIHGSGTHEPELAALAANPPPGWTISLHGPVPNLSSRMGEFDLMLMPSRYEGLALLAIEAALVGLPVIATDGPGVREGFPADYPWLARAGDAASFAAKLQNALNDRSPWPAVAEQARHFAQQHFDVRAMCDAYARLYADALRAR